MTNVIDKEITGAPIVVAIRGTQYPLAYPMHNVILYKQRSGDSLFDPASWPKIDLTNDPERWLSCLWAGLHEQQADKSWKAPLTIEQLEGLIDFSNAGEISIRMVEALTQFMPKAKDVPKKEAPETSGETPAPLTSPASGPVPATVTASPGTSS